MTTEELAKLTPEDKRIKIAELCGYEANCFVQDGEVFDAECNKVPDYLNDLNAMHGALKVLEPSRITVEGIYANKKWGEFVTHHNRICEADGNSAFHSSATQRADAFLLTLG